MGETVYSIGEFPGHEVLAEILDQGPMPKEPGMRGTALQQTPLDLYLRTVQDILESLGYPTNSMELDALAMQDPDGSRDIDDMALRFTILLRLVHRTKSAWRDGNTSEFGYYMGQLSKVTNDAKYYERLPHTISGTRSYLGAKKSAEQRARLKQVKATHKTIRREAQNMLAVGYSRHELASRLHRKFRQNDEFPSSVRQYRTILQSLK